eukprot:CFRG8303T1
MFRKWCTIAVAMNALGFANSATIDVAPGADTIQAAIDAANDGDTIQLSEGQYTLSNYVIVDKDVVIAGVEGTVVMADGVAVPALFLVEGLGARLRDFLITDTNSQTSCSFQDPQPLNISFMYDIYSAPKGLHLFANSLIIAGDIGPYYNTRSLSDIEFGSCKWSEERASKQRMARAFMEVQTNDCRANIGFSVAFEAMKSCGVSVTDYATLSSYEVGVVVSFEEEINMEIYETDFDFPNLRTGEAFAQLSLQLDRTQKICSNVEVWHAPPDSNNEEDNTTESALNIIEKINAAITDLDLGAVNDNTSIVEISIVVPCPHGVYPLTAGGTIEVENSDDDQTTASDWAVIGDCSESCSNGEGYCKQKIFFEIVSCDLTATYLIQDLPLGCVPETQDCTETGQKANITFNIDTNELCDENIFNISDAFMPTVSLRTDNTHSENRDNFEFTVSDDTITYWTIHLWTNDTGLNIERGEFVRLERHLVDPVTGEKIEDSCEGYPFYDDDVTMLPQVFNRNQYPAEIDTEIPMSNMWMCEDGDLQSMNNGTTFMFCWFVVVEYVDFTDRRRRREVESKHSWEHDNFGDNGMDFEKRDTPLGGIGHGLIDVNVNNNGVSSKSVTADGSIAAGDETNNETSIALAVGIGAGIVFGVVGLLLCIVGAYYVKSQRRKEKNMFVYQNAFYPQGGSLGGSIGAPPRQMNQPGGTFYRPDINNVNNLSFASASSTMRQRDSSYNTNSTSQTSHNSASSHEGPSPQPGGSFYGMEEHSSV